MGQIAPPYGTLGQTIGVANNGAVSLPTQFIPVAASQTIKYGDILTMSSGQLTQAIALPSVGNVTHAGGVTVFYVAVDSITTNASGVDTSQSDKTNLEVVQLDGSVKLLMQFIGGNSGSAASSTGTRLQDVTLNSSYQLGRYNNSSATGDNWYFISTGTSSGELTYLEVAGALAQPTNTSYAQVWVTVNRAYQGIGD